MVNLNSGIKTPRKYEDALIVFGYFIDKLNFEVILTDERLNIEWLNRAAKKKIPHGKNLFGENWHTYLLPDEPHPENCNVCQKILSSKETFSETLDVPRKNEVIYIQVLAFILNLPLWDTKKYLIILEDVTEAERERREALSLQKMTNQAIQSSGDAFIFADENNRILSWNLGAELIFGYTAEEVKNKKIDLFLPVPPINSQESPGRSNKSPFIGKTETAAKRKDGREIVIDLTYSEVYDDSGNLEGRSFFAKDITRRRNLQDQLKHFIQEFYKLNALNEHLYCSTDFNELISTILLALTTSGGLNFDRAAILFADLKNSLLKGEYAMGPSTRNEAEKFKDFRDKKDFYEVMIAFAKKKYNQNDYSFVDKIKGLAVDIGQKNHLLISAMESRKTYFLQNGKFPGYSGKEPDGLKEITAVFGKGDIAIIPLSGKHDPIGVLVVDNSFSGRKIPIEDLEILRVFASQASLAIENARLHKQAQEQYQELSGAYRRLQEQQEEMLKFQRLAALGEMSAKIAHEIRNPLVSMGGLAKAIEKMSEEGSKIQRFASLIYQQAINLETLLENMLLLAGPRPLNLSRQKIKEMVDEIIFTLKFAKDCGSCEISNKISEDLTLNVDGYKIRQVITNLIRNAVQAMGKNGKLEIFSEDLGENIEIHFRDYGPGISEENREKMFEPFYTTKKDGTGLGLTISRQIMRQHGGEILAKSVLLRGTDMILVFPAADTNHNS